MTLIAYIGLVRFRRQINQIYIRSTRTWPVEQLNSSTSQQFISSTVQQFTSCSATPLPSSICYLSLCHLPTSAAIERIELANCPHSMHKPCLDILYMYICSICTVSKSSVAGSGLAGSALKMPGKTKHGERRRGRRRFAAKRH